MSSVNRVILIGRLGRDPEMRTTSAGDRIANMTLATTETWRDRASGERKERTDWHTVVVYDERLSEIVERYLRKGSQIYVEGTLQTRKWTDKQGQDHYATEVILSKFRGQIVILDSGDLRGATSRDQRSPARTTPVLRGGSARTGPRGSPNTDNDLDDEIPFIAGDSERDWMLAENRNRWRA